MYIYIYMHAAGCLSEPHFSLESHETCENIVQNENKLENGTAKGAHHWGSVMHPKMKITHSSENVKSV